ncbi:18K peptidoglycan-associated outer membrane lipoprotein [Minicystis rosea]|nr:18K peptidoglycan-associated outer membrane lipoprotein [Minicystis rosea]
MQRMHVIALAAVATALSAGCGSEPAPAPRFASAPMTATDAMPRAAAPQPMPAPVRQDTATPTSGSVHIDNRILKACGNLPTARFAFDSSSIQPEAAAALDALAHCFTRGALAGHRMTLIGHTDPRGEVEYNLGLGQRRAGSVADYIAARGMARTHLSTSSRGEFDSVGTDEDGWARDRKVDVILAD